MAPFALILWDPSKKVNSDKEQQLRLNPTLVGWKNSYWDEVKRTRPQATRLDSGVRALSVGDMKSKSNPEGKPSQINAPHTDHGRPVAVWVSPKYYDPHFQDGD